MAALSSSKLIDWSSFGSELENLVCDFAAAGYLGLSAFLGLAIVIGKNGGDIQYKAYLSTVETIIYDPIIVLVKISILLQYVTLFVAHRRSVFHYTIHATIWIIVLFYIAVTFVYIFSCNPRRKLWIPSTPGHCQHEHGRGVFSGSINIASDFVILILPLPIILRLQMPFAKKLRLTLVFSFGFLASKGIIRFAEISIGIIVSCLPLVHKSVKHLWTKFPSTSSLRKSSTSSGGSSWWRLLGKSSSSASESGKTDSKDSGSGAPQIGTLNMTRVSFSAGSEDFASGAVRTEKTLPAIPSPIYAKEAVPTRFTNGVEDAHLPKKLDDMESATQTLDLTQPWQHQGCTAEIPRNETKRARYDLYSE
ncbi:MAG: hypothetical protein Q9226_006152 [Calogaya cf. arnoldii]